MKIKMSYSKTGLQLTEGFEGCKLESYQDSGGVWTIGYGHTSPEIREGMKITVLQAVEYLVMDIQCAVNTVNFYVIPQLTQNEFDALVDFTFNVGSDYLHDSGLLKLVNESKFDEAANEFEKWDHCNSKVVAGLLRRRIAEHDLFLEHYA